MGVLPVKGAVRTVDGALPDGIPVGGQEPTRPASASGKILNLLRTCLPCSKQEHEHLSALRPERTKALRFAFPLCAVPDESLGLDQGQTQLADELAGDVQGSVPVVQHGFRATVRVL